MNDKLDGERADRALDIAIETMNKWVMDGEDPMVVQTIFGIGTAVSAHIYNIPRDQYLEICRSFYDSTPAFLKEIGLLED